MGICLEISYWDSCAGGHSCVVVHYVFDRTGLTVFPPSSFPCFFLFLSFSAVEFRFTSVVFAYITWRDPRLWTRTRWHGGLPSVPGTNS